jgi:hypothetical protein
MVGGAIQGDDDDNFIDSDNFEELDLLANQIEVEAMKSDEEDNHYE